MVEYRHQFLNEQPPAFAVGKVVCVGRNYAAHAKELKHPIPETPLLFIKPSTAIVSFLEPLQLPDSESDCHYEAEIAVLIGETLKQPSVAQINEGIAGYGLGLDLTLRQLQTELKQQGHPWELAKGFDGACPLTPFVRAEAVSRPRALGLKNKINGNTKQWGHVAEMLNPIVDLIQLITQTMTLLPGDVVLTGTPAGVGPLIGGDQLDLELLLYEGEDKTALSEVLLRCQSYVLE